MQKLGMSIQWVAFLTLALVFMGLKSWAQVQTSPGQGQVPGSSGTLMTQPGFPQPIRPNQPTPTASPVPTATPADRSRVSPQPTPQQQPTAMAPFGALLNTSQAATTPTPSMMPIQ